MGLSFNNVNTNDLMLRASEWAIDYQYILKDSGPKSGVFTAVAISELDAINRLINYMCNQTGVVQWQIDGLSSNRRFSMSKDKSELVPLERIVRDAIICYQESFRDALNDDAEEELKRRAVAANNWLRGHGFQEEKLKWNKEEICF